MPSLVVVAAAYAAYKQNQKQTKQQLVAERSDDSKQDDDDNTTALGDRITDPSQQRQRQRQQLQEQTVSLKDKTIIPLLHGIEQEASTMSTAVGDIGSCSSGGMYHAAPISTITFCNGDPVEASQLIGTKLGRILQCNPWLTGWIIREERRQSHDDRTNTCETNQKEKSSLYLCYDPECKDVCSNKELFKVFLSGDNDIQLSQKTTKYEDMCTILESNNLLVERNENLVVDIAYDTHEEDDENDEVDSKKQRRFHNPSKSLFKVSIIPDASDNPKNHQYAVVVSMSHLLGDACTYYKFWNMLLLNNNEHPIVALQPNRNQEFQSTLRMISSSETKSNGDNRRGDNQTRDDGDEVAVNRKQIFNMISNSYTLSSNGANNGPAMLLSRWAKSRDPTELRIFTVSEEYIQRQKNEEIIAASMKYDGFHRRNNDTSEDDRSKLPSPSSAASLPSTNSILTSSFFQATNANVGFMVCNMRNRLLLPPPEMKNSSVFDAGNYTQ